MQAFSLICIAAGAPSWHGGARRSDRIEAPHTPGPVRHGCAMPGQRPGRGKAGRKIRAMPQCHGWWGCSPNDAALAKQNQPELRDGHHVRPSSRSRRNTSLLRAPIAGTGRPPAGAEHGPTHGQTGNLSGPMAGQSKLADRLLLPSDLPLSSCPNSLLEGSRGADGGTMQFSSFIQPKESENSSFAGAAQ